MSARKTHGDDVLFISALGVLLFGVGFLLRTTGLLHGYRHLWPILVVAVGGMLCWSAMARRGGPAIFTGGIFFLLFGCISLGGVIYHWRFGTAWPLIMSAAGLAWLLGGFRVNRRARVGFVAPGLGFVILGLFFSLFSFKIVGVSFGRFMTTWWPTFFIAGGIILFIAYGLSRRGRAAADEEGEEPIELP
jgi:hypothetical protein